MTFLSEGIEKQFREKEKMLVTSIFSFSHNVFKRLLDFQAKKNLEIALCNV